MSFLTCRWLFPQKLQRSCSFPSLALAMKSPCTSDPAFRLPVGDDGVDQPVVPGLVCGHVVVALHVLRDLVGRLIRVLGDDLLQAALEIDRLAGLDLDVGALALESAGNLVNEDLGVRQGRPLSLCARREKQRAHRHGDADARGRHLAADELHRVVDGEAGVHRAARRVDVELDVLVRVLGLEMDHLRDGEVRDHVVDRRAEKDDALVQQARVDVEEALAARGLLDDGWDDQVRRVRVHVIPQLPGVQSFASVCGFSFSGVQIDSRASASSRGMRVTSEAMRSSALRSRRSSRSDSKRPLSRRRKSCSSASSPKASAWSRTSSSTSESATSMPSWSAAASSTSSRATERAASPRRRAMRSSADWPVMARYVSSWTPRASTCRASERSSSRVRVSTSGPDASTFDAATSASATSERNCASTSSSICSRIRSSMSARSSANVSNSLEARASSSSSGGSTFSLISFTVTVTACVDSSASSNGMSFVSPALMPTSPCSISSTTAPRPSSRRSRAAFRPRARPCRG